MNSLTTKSEVWRRCLMKSKKEKTHMMICWTEIPTSLETLILDEYKKDETNISNYPELIMAQDLSKAWCLSIFSLDLSPYKKMKFSINDVFGQHVSAWVLILPCKPQPSNLFCPPPPPTTPQALKNLTSPPRQTKSPDNSNVLHMFNKKHLHWFQSSLQTRLNS